MEGQRGRAKTWASKREKERNIRKEEVTWTKLRRHADTEKSNQRASHGSDQNIKKGGSGKVAEKAGFSA